MLTHRFWTSKSFYSAFVIAVAAVIKDHSPAGWAEAAGILAYAISNRDAVAKAAQGRTQ